MRVFNLMLALLTGLVLTAPVLAAPNADEAARLTKAEALIAMTGVSKLGEQMLDMVAQQTKQQMLSNNPGREQEITTMIDDHIRPAFKEAMPELMRGMAGLYAVNFTAAEMEEIMNFYRTPVGQKTLKQLPTLMQQSMALGQSWGMGVAQRAIADFEKAARAKGMKL